MKQNRGKGRRIFTTNNLDLTFHDANHRAEFHENGIKIAAVGARTDASDCIICPAIVFDMKYENVLFWG